MTSSTPRCTPITQAVVTGAIDDDATPTGHVGTAEFPIGGPDGRGGLASGPNPYDLLSASLAACTAMTIRLHARHKNYPLSHVEVAVSYHHSPEGGRDSFERTITLQGSLDDDQRAQLLRGANMCPVRKTLGLSAETTPTTWKRLRSSISIPTSAQVQMDLLSRPYQIPEQRSLSEPAG
jgi:putative redox protein